MKTGITILITALMLTFAITPAIAAQQMTAVTIYLDNPTVPDYDGTVSVKLSGESGSGSRISANIPFSREHYMTGTPAALSIAPGTYNVKAMFEPCQDNCDICVESYKLTDAQGIEVSELRIASDNQSVYWQFLNESAVADNERTDVSQTVETPAESAAPETLEINQVENTDDIEISETATEYENALTPLWSFLSKTGKSLSATWLSIIVLAISGAGFLIVYLRRKSYAVTFDNDGDK